MSTTGPRRLIDAKTPDDVWGHPLANEYLRCLCGAYGGRANAAVRRLAAGCGLGTAALPGDGASMEELWAAVLETAAADGNLPGVARAVCADERIAEHRERLRALAEWDFEARIAGYLHGLLGVGGPSRVGELVGKYVDLSAMPTSTHVELDSPLDPFIHFADGGDWPQVEGVYHPAPSRGSISGPGEEPAGKAEAEPVPRVARKLCTATRAVLLGEPGSGKTWTLMRVLVAHSLAWLEADQGARRHLPIPVFVPLREFSGRRKAPDGSLAVESFAQFLARSFRDLAPIHGLLLRQERVVLLLDAFNEMPRRVPEDDTRDLTEELRTAIADASRFVLSCRKHDYRNELSHLPELAQLELQPLVPPQIQAVIAARFGGPDEDKARSLWREIGGSDALLAAWAKTEEGGYTQDFWRRDWRPPRSWDGAKVQFEGEEHRAIVGMHEDARLMHLARNPFRLGWLTRIYSETGTIPANRAALFETLIHRLLNDESQRATQLKAPWPEGRVGEIRAAMEAVALSMQAAGRTALPQAMLEGAIGGSRAPHLLLAARGANILADLDGELAFDHQLFQEYFAARPLKRRLERGEPPNDLFEQGEGWWDPHVWRETFHILAEHVAEEEVGRELVSRWLASNQPRSGP